MNINYFKFIIALVFIFGGSSFAQSISYAKPPGISHVSSLEYKFKLGWFTLGGGSFNFDSPNVMIDDQEHATVNAYAYTDGMAAFFTEMDDHYTSIINIDNLKPYQSEKHVTIKSGYWDQWNTFDYEKKTIDVKAIKTKKGEKSDRDWTVNMTNDSYDIVGSFVYFMNVDWTKQALQDTVLIMTHYKKKVYPVGLIYKGKDTIKFNGDKVKTHRMQIYLPADDEYTVGRPVYVWLSTDGKNIPLVVQSKLTFGNARCELIAVNGKDVDD